MKKTYMLSAAGLVAAGLLTFLFFKSTRAVDTSLHLSDASTNTASEVPARSGHSSAIAQKSTDWASKPSDEIYRSFHETKSRAEAGDPIAQRQLAETYERCAMYSLSPQKFAGTLDSFSELKKENSARYKQIKDRTSHYCSQVDGGEAIPLDAIELWYAEAAKRGDLIARLKVASRKTMSSDDYRDLIAKAIESKDAEAIFAVDEVLSNPAASVELESFAPGGSGNYSEYAWALAGCRAGADCGQGSYRLDMACISYGVCNSSSYEELIRKNLVPPGQLKALDKEVEKIRLMMDAIK
ncbi:hypothetical protein X12_001142 [Xanthomonas arboricola]|uniref:hypothetical protein n=1 Tax=Xanthomonas arboricola TaxID=56448 RepID=UPI002B2D8B5A|nr:hypothetical protein X12_001142 [Xanthomonas arboricola]